MKKVWRQGTIKAELFLQKYRKNWGIRLKILHFRRVIKQNQTVSFTQIQPILFNF